MALPLPAAWLLALMVSAIALHWRLVVAPVAVLDSGLANVYSRQHRRLAEQIVEQGGAVVSDHLVTDLPVAAHFPRRNRIISGLSLGVLVIEVSLRGGAL